MADGNDKLTEEDVQATRAEPLPDREAMTVMRPPLPYEIEPLPPVYTTDPPPPEEA
jgi:hypothetical protein